MVAGLSELRLMMGVGLITTLLVSEPVSQEQKESLETSLGVTMLRPRAIGE